MKKIKLGTILFVLSTLGLLNHFYLLILHYKVHYALDPSKSVCNLGAGFNCDAVAASPYSAFFGVPIALLGAVFQLVVIWFLISSKILPETRQKSLQSMNVIILFSAVTSVVMGGISMALVKSVCLFCMAAYLISWLQLAVAAMISRDEKLPFLGMNMTLVKAGIGAILATLFLNFAFAKNYGGRLNEIAVDNVRIWESSPVVEFDLTAGLVKRSEKPAKMTIVEFADFRCPHCRFAAKPLHAFAESRQDVQFIFKSFPLDGVCNSAMEAKGDGTSCLLAGAVLCAEQQSKQGFALHDYIFENQEAFTSRSQTEELLKETSPKLGLSWDNLKGCAESSQTMDQLQKMADEGKKADIRGTPSIFVNGKRLERGQYIKVLETAYKSL